MAQRYERNTAVLYKLETVYNTDPLPVPATDAMLVRKFSCDTKIKYESVKEVRPWMGDGLDIPTVFTVEGSLEVSLAGAGAVDTPPMWGRWLRSSGFAETITALSRVEYTLISAAFESGYMYYEDDGVLKKSGGIRANLSTLKMMFGATPYAGFNFIGLDGGDAAVPNQSPVLTAWKTPRAVNNINSGQLMIGCTYSAGTLVGGTPYPSQGLELSLGGKISDIGLLGGQEVDFTDRATSGKIMLDLTAAQEVANMATVKSGATQGIGIVHGTVGGEKILVFSSASQLKNPKKTVLNGKRVISYDLHMPALTANSELIIVTM